MSACKSALIYIILCPALLLVRLGIKEPDYIVSEISE